MLNDRDFQALIKLLDDDDPDIHEHVWSKLFEVGASEPERLEAAWMEEKDPVIQKRLSEVIHRISIRSAFDGVLDWRKGGGMDMLEGWIALSRIRYPEMDPVYAKNEINRLVNKTWLAMNNQMSSQQKLRVLNHILFSVEGFRNNKSETHNPDYNFVDNVFRRKKGNAMTLGILYLLICRKLDLPVHGVIVPGYFILVFLDRDEEFFIDVFNGGLFFKREDLQRFLKEMNVEEKPSFFKPTSNIYTLLHLVHYMIKDYSEQNEMDKVAELNELLTYIEIRLDGLPPAAQ